MDSITNHEDKRQRNTRIAKYLTLFFTCLLFLNFIIISLLYSWADWIALLIFSLLFIVPAYLSNAGMVIVGKGKPVDGGKNWSDGRRILGDHKTWNGLIKGPLYIGIPISLGVFLIFIFLWDIIKLIPDAGIPLGIYKLYNDILYYQYYFIGGPIPIGFILILIRIILCSYGAGIGDLIGSFLKRRFNIESGEPFWVIDSLDFAGIAIIFASIPSFFLPGLYLAPDIFIISFLLILTPSVSIIANTVAYIIGLKDVPW
ncbi:MAG: CDP-archaeol synthase [Promethearchaeota archaeon]|nr:MAG: CDP-archaeol synthase [Candidatus Lokiarchaeota archaeon]